MGRYIKKPIEVEAIRFTGNNQEEVEAFLATAEADWDGESWYIHTLEGDMRADVGDWIIKGVKGEFYPCKPDIFEATYEAL